MRVEESIDAEIAYGWRLVAWHTLLRIAKRLALQSFGTRPEPRRLADEHRFEPRQPVDDAEPDVAERAERRDIVGEQPVQRRRSMTPI